MEIVKMRNVSCDNCDREITEKYYEICILIYGDSSDVEEESTSFQFCSEKCMGKWMIEKAKEAYGVYE